MLLYSSGESPTLVCIFEIRITKVIAKILAISTNVIGSENMFSKIDDRKVISA